MVSQRDYSTYRYVIHMPGSATGSYSRNLQYMFFHEAIVVLWRGIGWEWYYPALVDGTNCVIADETDIVAKLDALEADPELQARLRAAAWPFHEAHISGE